MYLSLRIVLGLCLALVLLSGTAFAGTVVTNTSSPNAAILPDNGCVDDTNGTGGGGITDAIAFTETGVLSDVDVRVEITQTWRGDLQMALTYTGGGGSVVLANNHGGSADNYFATFDSDAATPCSADCGVAGNCNVTPGPSCQPNQSLNAFDGLNSPGTWTLAICDRATGDLGNLVLWAVTLTGDPLPVELTTFTVD